MSAIIIIIIILIIIIIILIIIIVIGKSNYKVVSSQYLYKLHDLQVYVILPWTRRLAKSFAVAIECSQCTFGQVPCFIKFLPFFATAPFNATRIFLQ